MESHKRNEATHPVPELRTRFLVISGLLPIPYHALYTRLDVGRLKDFGRLGIAWRIDETLPLSTIAICGHTEKCKI